MPNHVRRNSAVAWLTIITGQLLVALAATTQTRAFADEADPKQVLGVLATGYSNYRNSFETIDCRFEVAQGRTTDLESARRGELNTATKKVRFGHWLVNREFVRYELLCDPEVTKAVQKELIEHRPVDPQDKTVKVDCFGIVCLAQTGKLGFTFNPLISVGTIGTPNDTNLTMINYTPFSMGVMGIEEQSNPSHLIRDALHGRHDWRFVGTEQSIAGRRLLVCELGPKGHLRLRMGFDPERGYMLATMSDRFPEKETRIYEAHVLEAKQCANGSWFPLKTVVVWDPDTDSNPVIDVVEVKELDTDRPPEMEQFAIELPANIQVNRPGQREWVNIVKPESVTVLELEQLYRRCVENSRKVHEIQEKLDAVRGTPQPPPDNRLRTRIVLGINVAILILIVGSLVVRRRMLGSINTTTETRPSATN